MTLQVVPETVTPTGVRKDPGGCSACSGAARYRGRLGESSLIITSYDENKARLTPEADRALSTFDGFSDAPAVDASPAWRIGLLSAMGLAALLLWKAQPRY